LDRKKNSFSIKISQDLLGFGDEVNEEEDSQLYASEDQSIKTQYIHIYILMEMKLFLKYLHLFQAWKYYLQWR
jgi:hypothetical protein